MFFGNGQVRQGHFYKPPGLLQVDFRIDQTKKWRFNDTLCFFIPSKYMQFHLIKNNKQTKRSVWSMFLLLPLFHKDHPQFFLIFRKYIM